jgi:hypothetical protein
MRSCIACREKKTKKDLIRLAGKDGVVEVDTQGKKIGRGVYLCPFSECWETGLKGNRLEHALKTSMTWENRTTLLEYGKSLPEKGKTRDE